jgi:DNA-directed RNA polymerase sigma subunit (sigma70/sigma32)
MMTPMKRRERRRKNSRRSTSTAAAAATSVLAATAVIFGSSIGSGGGGADAFSILSSTLAKHSSCAHTTAMSPTMTNRRRSLSMVVPRDYASIDSTRQVLAATTTTSSSTSLPRLSRRQEISLLRRMRDHPSHSEESQSARQLLLLHNLPLVQSIVTKLLRSRGTGMLVEGSSSSLSSSSQAHPPLQKQLALAREDLVNEGTIGLAEAIDKYDLAYAHSKVEEGTEGGFEGGGSASLGTYATYWIRARVIRAMQRGEHSLLRFPEHAVQASHRLVKAARDMGLAWDDVVAMLADQQQQQHHGSVHDRKVDVDVVDEGSVLDDDVARIKLREKLRIAAGISTDGLFRDAVRVRSMSRAGSTTPLEPWMLYSPSTSSDLASNAADGIAIDDDLLGQEHIVETLSKFLIPREVEVLSLRYGLVSPSLQTEVTSDVVPTGQTRATYRDYEAEAEEELFGPSGILSHYSATPVETYTPGNRITATSIGQIAKPEMAAAKSYTTLPGLSTSSSPSLLPFREIGKRMEFSAEYCRRTCSAALAKLSRAAEEGRLAESDFLLGW